MKKVTALLLHVLQSTRPHDLWNIQYGAGLPQKQGCLLLVLTQNQDRKMQDTPLTAIITMPGQRPQVDTLNTSGRQKPDPRPTPHSNDPFIHTSFSHSMRNVTPEYVLDSV